MTPKVSVTVVTYNHQDYIAQCLDSILSQEVNFDYEIVIGEDASTDNTRKIVMSFADKYPNKIKPIFHQSNVGGKDNFISVNESAKGDYIAHIDGDDLMLPGKLQKQSDFLDAHPECAIVCHNVRAFENKTNRTLYYFNQRFKKPISTIEDLVKYGTIFCHSSKMFRKISFPKEGIDINTKNVGDWLFNIQNARFGKIGYIDEVLGEYRKHSGGITNININKKMLAFKDQIYTLEKAREYGVSEESIRYGYARLNYIYAWDYFINNKLDEFKQFIKESGEYRIFMDRTHRFLYRARHFAPLLSTIRKIKNKLL